MVVVKVVKMTGLVVVVNELEMMDLVVMHGQSRSIDGLGGGGQFGESEEWWE